VRGAPANSAGVKTRKLYRVVASGAACAAAGALTARAQSGGPYQLLSSSIDAGGGSSGQGIYSLAGTVAQPDAGASAGGAYRLESGFWHGLSVVQLPGAPVLKLRVAGGRATLSWPATVTGFSLESCTDLAAGDWMPVAGTPSVRDNEHTVTLPAAGLMRSFRLRHTNPQP
jgi:hypothetical protein